MKERVFGAAGPLKWALAAAVLMTVLLYVPTPYLVFQPGLAESAAPLVHAAASEPEGEGDFLITTVYLSPRSNYWNVLRAWMDRDAEIMDKKAVLGGDTIQEYAYRSVVMMENSQSDALEAAYRAAEIPYSVMPTAVVVTNAGGGAQGFHTGDRLLSVNGVGLKSLSQLQRLLTGLIGREAEIAASRSGGPAVVTVTPEADLGDDTDTDGLIGQNELARVLGVKELAELLAVQPADPARKVTIRADGVGGPSAGLVFALEAYDRLMPGDLTGGRQIAGTGTILPSGEVGPIGGVSLKVAAAVRAGADVFLAPSGNYEEAAAKARKLGSGIRILKVDSLADAVKRLEEPATP